MTENEVPAWEWPQGPGAEWVRMRQIELVRLLKGRLPVFLDMNFWILVREVASGIQTGAVETSLAETLSRGVQAGKIFCPVTCDMIEELSKQNTENQAGTMEAIERLGLGVAMVPHQERTAIEVERSMASAWPNAEPVERPVWTAFAFAYGYEDLRPQIEGLVIPDDLICRLAEKAWMERPTILAAHMPLDGEQARQESERLAEKLNEAQALHAHEIDSFETAWRIEVAGACS